MNQKQIIITGITISLLIGFIITTMMWALTPIEEKTITAHVKISNYTGINLDTDKLYFGTIKPGDTAERSMIIKTGIDAITIIRAEGEIADWLTTKNSVITTKAGKEKNVKFIIITPKNATPGNHTATIKTTTYPSIARIIMT